eukprot:COSAG01_NODE_2799_length_7053_cov_21.482456_13_plen_171_part_00
MHQLIKQHHDQNRQSNGWKRSRGQSQSWMPHQHINISPPAARSPPDASTAAAAGGPHRVLVTRTHVTHAHTARCPNARTPQIRVRVEIMGSPKYENVRESQPVLTLNDPGIYPRPSNTQRQRRSLTTRSSRATPSSCCRHASNASICPTIEGTTATYRVAVGVQTAGIRW